MNKTLKTIGVGCILLGAATGTGVLVKRYAEKKALKRELLNRKRYVFSGICRSNNQLETERFLTRVLNRALKENGTVESIRCRKAVKADDEFFPDEYDFTFEISILSSQLWEQTVKAVSSIYKEFAESMVLTDISKINWKEPFCELLPLVVGAAGTAILENKKLSELKLRSFL